MTARPELRALTSIRGIAAWLVVLYHIRLTIAGLPPAIVAIFAKGYLAVDFFFLLSGFVIWLTYGERLRTGGLPAAAAFLRRRVARIWPLHLVMLAAALALVALLAATGRHDPADFPLAELPLHVVLLQNWGFTTALSWNDPAWSISAELGAYLLFPILAIAIDWRRVPTAAIMSAIAALIMLLHVVMARGGAPTLGTDIARFGLIRCVIEFAVGTASCGLWLRWAARPTLPAALSGSSAILLLAAWTGGLAPETLVVPAAFTSALLGLALTSGMARNPLEGALLHYLGAISYATYLSHFLLFFAFKLALVNDARAIAPTLIALFLAIVLAASVALHHLVERPAQRWLSGLGGGRRRPLPA